MFCARCGRVLLPVFIPASPFLRPAGLSNFSRPTHHLLPPHRAIEDRFFFAASRSRRRTAASLHSPPFHYVMPIRVHDVRPWAQYRDRVSAHGDIPKGRADFSAVKNQATRALRRTPQLAAAPKTPARSRAAASLPKPHPVGPPSQSSRSSPGWLSASRPSTAALRKTSRHSSLSCRPGGTNCRFSRIEPENSCVSSSRIPFVHANRQLPLIFRVSFIKIWPSLAVEPPAISPKTLAAPTGHNANGLAADHRRNEIFAQAGEDATECWKLNAVNSSVSMKQCNRLPGFCSVRQFQNLFEWSTMLRLRGYR